VRTRLVRTDGAVRRATVAAGDQPNLHAGEVRSLCARVTGLRSRWSTDCSWAILEASGRPFGSNRRSLVDSIGPSWQIRDKNVHPQADDSSHSIFRPSRREEIRSYVWRQRIRQHPWYRHGQCVLSSGDELAHGQPRQRPTVEVAKRTSIPKC
jgi:hypothetical protein